MYKRALYAFAVMLAASPLALAENIALVVGVSSYGDDRSDREAAGFHVPTPLPNAVNDARLIGDALKSAGFDVALVENPSRRQLLSAVYDFSSRLRSAGAESTGVFYFAGHGAQGVPPFQRDVDNYLIPIGSDLASETDLASEAVPLSGISSTISGSEAGAVILILDACRNFALPQANRSGFASRGLAEARAHPGTLIAYSTAPGSVASDGPAGGNGPYAESLALEIRNARGTVIEDIFRSVRRNVLAATSGDQTPWENASLLTRVTIGSEGESAPSPQTTPDQFVFNNLQRPCEYAMFARDYSSSPLAPIARSRAGATSPCDVGESSNKSVAVQTDSTVSEPKPTSKAGRAFSGYAVLTVRSFVPLSAPDANSSPVSGFRAREGELYSIEWMSDDRTWFKIKDRETSGYVPAWAIRIENN